MTDINPFKPAVKRVEPFRLALVGPSGSGKTYTGLAISRLLAGVNGRVACLDTEKGSARKYAHIFQFDHAAMKPPYAPSRYAQALAAAGHAEYDVCLVDSITHAWDGAGGVQEIVDTNTRGANKFSGWAAGTPAHNLLVESLLGFPGHLIATMRAKTLWDTTGGKPIKIGLGAVQRAGIEYEFDVVAMLDVDHVLTIDKTRCPDLDGQRFTPADLPEFARIVLAWLAEGVPAEIPDSTPRPPAPPHNEPVAAAPTTAPVTEPEVVVDAEVVPSTPNPEPVAPTPVDDSPGDAGTAPADYKGPPDTRDEIAEAAYADIDDFGATARGIAKVRKQFEDLSAGQRDSLKRLMDENGIAVSWASLLAAMEKREVLTLEGLITKLGAASFQASVDTNTTDDSLQGAIDTQGLESVTNGIGTVDEAGAPVKGRRRLTPKAPA